jgi:hypothetical protein
MFICMICKKLIVTCNLRQCILLAKSLATFQEEQINLQHTIHTTNQLT